MCSYLHVALRNKRGTTLEVNMFNDHPNKVIRDELTGPVGQRVKHSVLGMTLP